MGKRRTAGDGDGDGDGDEQASSNQERRTLTGHLEAKETEPR